MVAAFPGVPYSFGALRKVFGPLFVRCDRCRRYAPLHLGEKLRDVDYRRKTFSCSACGAEAHLCHTEPVREAGMADYRLDPVEAPRHHPATVDRLLGQGHHRRVSIEPVRGERPGRRLEGRR